MELSHIVKTNIISVSFLKSHFFCVYSTKCSIMMYSQKAQNKSSSVLGFFFKAFQCF